MGKVKSIAGKLGAWMVLGISLTQYALQTDGLIPDGRWRSLVLFLSGAFGIIAAFMAQPLLKKSDEVRLAESLPEIPAEREEDKPKKPKKKPPVSLIFFCLFPLGLASCYCGKPENKDTAQCIAQAKAIECAKASIMSLVPSAIVIVKDLMSGGVVSWDPMIEALKKRGYEDPVCLLAVIRDLFLAPQSAPQGVQPFALPPDIQRQLAGLQVNYK